LNGIGNDHISGSHPISTMYVQSRSSIPFFGAAAAPLVKRTGSVAVISKHKSRRVVFIIIVP